jgi:hypothetical protein
MTQINEVRRMQELAGLTKEAPTMPPVPTSKPKVPPVPPLKPKMPPVPSSKPKMPPVPGKSSTSSLSDSLKEKYIGQAFDVVGATATYKKYKVLDDSEIKTLETILDKVMTGFQNLK